MSANADAGAEVSVPWDTVADRRREVLEALRLSREELERQIESGRIRDASKERERVKKHQALARVCKVELDALESAQLDQLSAEVEELKERGATRA